jgi:uncharacterized C2H2 Zn-finger protein
MRILNYLRYGHIVETERNGEQLLAPLRCTRQFLFRRSYLVKVGLIGRGP